MLMTFLPQQLTSSRNRNMKLSPSKFQIGSSVVFDGTIIEAQHQSGRTLRMRSLGWTQCHVIQPHLNVGRGASASSRRECTGRSRRKTILPVEPRIIVFCDAQSLGGFLSQDLEKIGNSRAQAMVEEMQPYPVEVRHVPGAKMELLDHGSCNPISYGQHKLFDTEVGSLGVCVRSNRVIPMESTLRSIILPVSNWYLSKSKVLEPC